MRKRYGPEVGRPEEEEDSWHAPEEVERRQSAYHDEISNARLKLLRQFHQLLHQPGLLGWEVCLLGEYDVDRR